MRITGVLRGVIVVAVTGSVVTLAPGGASAQPVNPSSGEITQAQQERSQRAAEVGRLAALVAVAGGDLQRASDEAELAVERYNKSVVDLQDATERAARAKASVATAGQAVAEARQKLGRFVRRSFQQGSTVNSTTALFDASSPGDLLAKADLLMYASRRQVDAVNQLNVALVRQANAESAARAAQQRQQQATAQAEQAKSAARQAQAEAQANLGRLQAQRDGLQQQLDQARIRLDGLLAERRQYAAWQQAQQVAAAQAQARMQQLQLAAASRGTGPDVGPPPGGWGSSGWTPARGQRVADAALHWLGTPYAWGGGDASGPTLGVDGPGDGGHDGSVRGFDCSGLALWAWAQVGVYLPHYSGYQYTSGRHVAVGDLRPGDLLFWAYDTSDPGSIHHVAIYLGGGQVVQAPQSGDVVKVSPMWFDGYLGATRPGT